MSWSTRTWQPVVRRDGPLLAVLAFFVAPSAFFLTVWYVDYFSGVTASVILMGVGAAGVLAPPLICYRLAGRAGRRGPLWFALVLSGLLLANWLPARYLVLDGPLPPTAYVVIPGLWQEALSATTVCLVPLAMGMIPVIMYGLAVGLDRPLAGIPPRGAVFLTAAGGFILWSLILYLSLLNPGPPLFAQTGARVEAKAEFTQQAIGSSDVVVSSLERFLWRLHDGLPPGGTRISPTDTGFQFQLPALAQTTQVQSMLTGYGVIEFVGAGDAPPSAGTEVSTSLNPLPAADLVLETVLGYDDILHDVHWSGISIGTIEVIMQSEAAVLSIHLNEDGAERLQQFSEENEGDFIAMVLDNVVVLSFPVPSDSDIEDNILTVRRVDPVTAAPLAAILRYGPLSLRPQVEVLSHPPATEFAIHDPQPVQTGLPFASSRRAIMSYPTGSQQ